MCPEGRPFICVAGVKGAWWSGGGQGQFLGRALKVHLRGFSFIFKAAGAKGFWGGGAELCFRENNLLTICETEWNIERVEAGRPERGPLESARLKQEGRH